MEPSGLTPDDVIARFQLRRRICLSVGIAVFLSCFVGAGLDHFGYVSGPGLATVILAAAALAAVLFVLFYRCPNCESVRSVTGGGKADLDPWECRECGAALKEPRAR